MVRKKFHIILSILFATLFLVGCQKAPINGDLDGRWQIVTIEKDKESIDVKDEQLYYNFYLHVCNLSFYGGVLTEGNFIYKDSKIYMEFPYINTQEGRAELESYGIYSNPVEFEIVKLDRKTLIIKEEDDNLVITLRKF